MTNGALTPDRINGSVYQIQKARAVAWSSLLVSLIMAALLGLLVRVGDLKLRPDPDLVLAAGATRASRTVLAPRGDLLDRRGRTIATSSVGYRLFVDPQVVTDPQTIAVDLAKAIDGDPVEIDRKLLARPGSRYVVVEDPVGERHVEAIRQADLRGVGLEPRLVRHYPHGGLASAVVGLVGFEQTGLAGMEHRFDRRLTPRHGERRALRDARRRALWIDAAAYEPPQPGQDVRLSIDLVIQEIAERRLGQALEDFEAAGGRLVVLDSGTGELLAVCDLAGNDDTTSAGRVHPALRRNRCVTDPYEPGSTFKPFVWSVATELGKARLDEEIAVPENGLHRTSRGRLIRDAHPRPPPLTWSGVLIRSLNSGMAIVAERMSHREMQEAVERFGFGIRTGCGMPGESSGLVTPASRWSHYTQTSVAMGHEIGVTAVQMARAFAVFARDGTMPAVRITAREPEDLEYDFVQRVLPQGVALTARQTLRQAVIEGTGRPARSRKFTLFGKSGTAQLPRPDGGGYYDDRYVSSFIAGAPFEDPRIVVLAVIDEPNPARGYYGGPVAGPIVRDVIEETLAYLGVGEEAISD
ncbi:MAG: peptidoglycan D,D-transpeptidase FtsI family protein [Planctomycetota bacterium]|jgi:cell division protein FtsI (penicillin-binding protein 3)